MLDGKCSQVMPFRNKETDKLGFDVPIEYRFVLGPVLQEYQKLFKRQLGQTHIREHVIDTGDASPIKVPPPPSLFTTRTGYIVGSKK